MNISCRIAAALTLLLGAAPASLAFTVPELQSLLRAAPKSVSFVETRESPWLAVPAEASGTMHSLPGVLEKRVAKPRAETWRILADRVEYVGVGDASSKQILFSKAPAVAVLANALRNAVTGDLSALEREFRVELRGDRSAWTARLSPTSGEAVRYLDRIELQGAGSELRMITIVERQGERTTTRLFP
jgi:hypothetical protein